MSRLITEDAVYEYLTDKFNEYDISIENEFVGKILDGLGDIPTAYDVEKVVHELREVTKCNIDCYEGRESEVADYDDSWNDDIISACKAIEIVRKGRDLISRSLLLDWIDEQRENVTKKQVTGSDEIFTREVLVTMQRCIGTFETAINNQPTVSNDGWIECSERLPEPGKRYLVSCIVKTGDIEEHTVWHAIYAGARGWYTVESKALNTEVKIEVIAWQPLPESYKPQQESKKTTNGERIRMMSDKELAYFLASIRESDEDTIVINNKEFFAESEILSWLQSETEG